MSKRAFHFPGVSVLVPEVDEYENIAVRMIEEITDCEEDQEDFSVIRYIGNIDLFPECDSEKPPKFHQPIELRVRYTTYDEREAKYYTKLKLAYWDGNTWVIISDDAHEYIIFPPSTARFAELKLLPWLGDPTLAWGK